MDHVKENKMKTAIAVIALTLITVSQVNATASRTFKCGKTYVDRDQNDKIVMTGTKFTRTYRLKWSGWKFYLNGKRCKEVE